MSKGNPTLPAPHLVIAVGAHGPRVVDGDDRLRLGGGYPAHGVGARLAVGARRVRTTALELFAERGGACHTLLLHQLRHDRLHRLGCLQAPHNSLRYNLCGTTALSM